MGSEPLQAARLLFNANLTPPPPVLAAANLSEPEAWGLTGALQVY